MPYQPIENYGIIGDLHTVALVGKNGSVDFMCFPNFDSPTIFASLLDDERGGRFQIEPILENGNAKQLYLPDTNVLLTRLHSENAVAELLDFMLVEDVGPVHTLIRQVKTIRGDVRYRIVCAPRFDYGRAHHRLKKLNAYEFIFESEGTDRTAVRLRASIPLDIQRDDVVAEFNLKSEQSAVFVLEDANNQHEGFPQIKDYVAYSLKETMNFWRRWASHSHYVGRWREAVNRSALTLKLLTFQPTGAIVAAPTFGLPEHIGGSRNWDYRYTWIRDAAFTTYAFLRLGYTQEAGAFMKWIEARSVEQDSGATLQVMYGLRGQRDLTESSLTHFRGYRNSTPVRIGNDAFRQNQLDIYGALMDSVYLYNKYGEPISYDLWEHLVRLVNWVCENWKSKDHGIWEYRSKPREFLYSRLFCWVAIDRGIRLAWKRSFPAPLGQWEAKRNEIYRDIFQEFWDPELQSFVQYKGKDIVDASTLLMPLVKFLSPTDPRWLSTLKAIERELVEDSLVYRYREREEELDGIPGDEGSFSMCSFWYIECLSRAGELQKAQFLFEKMIGYSNHLGLYSEELGPSTAHLGNFPQAFSHLAMISTAYDLNRRLG